MTAFTTLRVSVEGSIGRITLDRPERLNALGSDTLRELAAVAASFPESTRAVIVSGEGRAFSAGYDLTDTATDDAADLGAAMATAVQGMGQVTIASLHGFVVGGGVVLAAACDLRVAAAGTTFFIPEVAMGIPLAWGGVPLLVGAIGASRTLDLVLTCRRFDADEALAMGLVNRVVAAAELDDYVADLAGDIAAKASVAVRRTKQHVRATVNRQALPVSDADALRAALADPESQAAMAAYIDRFS